MYAGSQKGPARQLFDRGYERLVSVIPPDAQLSSGSKIRDSMKGKVPGKKGRKGWFGYTWSTERVPPEQIDAWGANIGLGGEMFPAVDIDVDDPELAQTILDLALERLGKAPIRLSRGSRRLIVYRTEELFTKASLLITSGDETHKVEILGRGRQYLVYGRHPSGVDYRWEGIEGLHEVGPEDLPTVTRQMLVSFLEELQEVLQQQCGDEIAVERIGDGAPPTAALPQADLEAPSLERLEAVVALIPNDFEDRDDYIKFGYAVRAAGGEAAEYIFQEWASRWEDGHNDPDQVSTDWAGFRPPFQIGWSWLQTLASENGYNPAEDDFEILSDAVDPTPNATDPWTEALEPLNHEYAVVQVGSSVVVLQEREGQAPLFLREKDFRLKTNDQRVPSFSDPKRTVLRGNAWLTWPRRRQYDRAVFKPGEYGVPPGEFNLWRGWAIEPSQEGSCERFLEHLRTVVCGDNDDHYEWFLDWLAQLFQEPQRKLGIAVALRGAQGAGKSIVGRALSLLLGEYHVTADKAEQVVGRFNSHLSHCLLLQAEEAFWGGSRSAAGTLKHLVTGDKLRIERKGIDSTEEPNFTRLLITTNEDLAWPASLDDRRLVIFDVADTRVGDHDYFDALIHELDNGGAAKLLHVLLNRQIDMSRLRAAPETEALAAQAAEAMSAEEVWLFEVLKSGAVPGHLQKGGSVRVVGALLYESYVDSLHPKAHRKNSIAFANFLKSRLGASKTGRRVVVTRGGEAPTKTTEYLLPALVDARSAYSRRGRGANKDWPDPADWDAIPPEEWVCPDFGSVPTITAANAPDETDASD